jgi:hypothetical protein
MRSWWVQNPLGACVNRKKKKRSISLIMDQLKSLEFYGVLIELGRIKASEQNWEILELENRTLKGTRLLHSRY